MERIELKNRKDQKIVGVLEKPEVEIRGTCIVQHGWGDHRNKPTIQSAKNAFLESGFQTFNFDTTNSIGESDGDYDKATLGLHHEDFEDVAKWAQEQDWFKGPLAVTGHSKGGYAVVRYAEDYPEKVSLVVAVAPVVSGKMSDEAHKKHYPEEYKELKEKGFIEKVGKSGAIFRNSWSQVEERVDHDLLPNASKVTIPILLIVGSEDKFCLPQTKALFDALPEGNKEMKIIEGAPHSYSETKDQEACKKYIKDWLTQ